MILRRGAVPGGPRTQGDVARYGGQRRAWALSDAGGLTQFGARVETLEPGARSSDRHWHEAEDEFLLVLAGEATVIEETGAEALGPGDAACWPAGVANAHTVANRSAEPCTYLIVGTRPERDVVRYPDLGRTLHHDAPRWRLEDAEGRVLEEGTV